MFKAGSNAGLLLSAQALSLPTLIPVHQIGARPNNLMRHCHHLSNRQRNPARVAGSAT